MNVVIDTSSLMSLAAGRILEFTIENITLIIPERVQIEVRGLSKNNDFEGSLAKQIKEFLSKEIKVVPSPKTSQEGEVECAYLANSLNEVEFLITDDTVALEKLERICKKKVRFSTLILYALYLNNKISKKQALQVLERMRVKRNWKDNVIFEQAVILLEKQD